MRISKIIGLFLVSALFVGCSNAQEGHVSEPKEVTENEEVIVTLVDKTEFQSLMEQEGSQLVDVRTPREVENGKIGDAVNLNFHDADFKDQLAGLDKSQPVLIYCASGGRSAKAVAMMKQMGFSEIHELEGGYRAWIQ
ncbi:MAG: hypothetical protein Crog4KO_01380 [Crocinitomicaceae bacterium]